MRITSVVIPNLNSKHIHNTISSILEQGDIPQNTEIIVVGLDEPGLIPSHERVLFVPTREPVCAARARNIGSRHAKGEFICFTDADCLVMPGWLSHLVYWLEKGYVAVGGSVGAEGRNYWGTCDNLVSFFPSLPFMPSGKRPYLPSLNLAISRRVLLEIGGFDESFPGAAGEDVDLSFRLRQRGYMLYFEPKALIIHNHERMDAQSVWRHLFRFGEVWMLLRERFPNMKKSGFWVDMARQFPYAFRISTPLVALFEVFRFFSQSSKMLQYWYTVPGLFWGKLALYNGIASAMLCKTKE